MIIQKFKKLVKHPGIFFRDFFVKRYPITNCEQQYSEQEEYSVYMVDEKINTIESRLRSSEDIDVDVIYTWVNDKDPNWIEKRKKYSSDNVACSNSADKARFENHNELYYSILSVKKNIPWVRNIYIITDSQKPDWLIEDEQVKIIDHKEIIDAEYLPTFNSHVIEAHLHNIEGLAENFIYFNDDVFVAKPLEKEHFFKKNGVASIFVADKSLRRMEEKGVYTATLQASKNSNTLLKEKFGMRVDLPLVHTYVPLKKSSYEYYWKENKDIIESFLSNKYRGEDDLNMATFLVPWSMYLNGESVIKSDICYYFNIRSNHALAQYKKILAMKLNGTPPHSFCINDVKASPHSIQDYMLRVTNFLNRYYC